VRRILIVLIVYLGFLTTFVLLARDQFKPAEMVRICGHNANAVTDESCRVGF
jgi:hypothetical protein